MSTRTLSLDEDRDERASMLEPRRLGFVILWSRDEPERVGERCLMPEGVGVRAVLGRGEPEHAPAPTDEPLLTWHRMRPGQALDTGPLRAATISRRQLLVSVHGPRLLELENLGRSPLVHEGRQVKTVKLTPGDLVELHARLLLMVIEHAPITAHEQPELHAFGRADAHGFVGESPAAWQLRAELSFIGPRQEHVLVRGPSGTGKELIARALHRLSSRADRPIVSRNAATFPESLIDAELFGNAKGYPQAGMPQRPGLIGEADGTSLFLDEFAELPAAMQAHLLRVLDAGEYSRLGEAATRRSDLRLIAATNRPLSAIKPDVLARLKLRVELPGLADRREDVPLIARHLLRSIASNEPELATRYFPNASLDAEPRMSLALVERLVRHPYTTHVRELEALLWRALAQSPGATVELWANGSGDDTPDDALDRSPEHRHADAPDDAVDPLSIPPEHIQAVLDEHGGRQEPAWRALGLSSRHVLTRLVRRYGLRVRGRA